MSVTIKDVARMANTSIATVSRAISGKPGVGDKKKKEIWEIIKRTGYQPHLFARSLVTQKSSTLGFVVSDLLNNVYVSVFRCVEKFFRARGYQIFLTDSERDIVKEKANIDLMRQNRVEAMVVLPVHDWRVDQDFEHLRELKSTGTPLVLFGRIDDPSLDYVTSEEVHSAYTLTKHVLGYGHRHLAFCGYEPENRCAVERYEGFCRALREGGLDPANARVFPFDDEWTTKRFDPLISDEDRPTALVMVNDTAAVIALLRVKQMGLSVPKDLSIVGFGDLFAASVVEPALTTSGENIDALGLALIDLLLERMENPLGTAIHRLIPKQLKIRGSAGLCPSLVFPARPVS